MARSFLATICFALLILACIADKEYEAHGHDHHHHAHDGHDHHDHESHKKLFTDDFADGADEDQREKLRGIANSIDTDRDGQIAPDEMRTYIEQRIKDQHTREADEIIAAIDTGKTNQITFDGYIRDNFGALDIQELLKGDKSDGSLRETRRTYLADLDKWRLLDKDGDKSLSYEEFRKFLRPENDEELRRLEINSMITEYDDDKDGKISASEYLKLTEAETGQADSLGSEIDKNNDGFGDFDEFARYYLPTSVTATDEETQHLLKECDTDKNGYCTPDEIVNAFSSFAGSQITDFGADLEIPRVEL